MRQYPEERVPLADLFRGRRGEEVPAAAGLLLSPGHEEKVRAIGSLHQALVSGVLVQWLIDPGRAPSSAQLALGMQAITDQFGAAS